MITTTAMNTKTLVRRDSRDGAPRTAIGGHRCRREGISPISAITTPLREEGSITGADPGQGMTAAEKFAWGEARAEEIITRLMEMIEELNRLSYRYNPASQLSGFAIDGIYNRAGDEFPELDEVGQNAETCAGFGRALFGKEVVPELDGDSCDVQSAFSVAQVLLLAPGGGYYLLLAAAVAAERMRLREKTKMGAPAEEIATSTAIAQP